MKTNVMPRGTFLSNFERGKVTALRHSGYALREIARKLNRSVGVVRNYLANPCAYGTKHGGASPTVLSEREKRLILRLASNGTHSVRKIKALAGVSASRWTAWRTIKRSGYLRHVKMQVGSKLDGPHKEQRLRWALKVIEDRIDWTSVIFSDEKKFNLDGPDGYACYWHDLRKAPLQRMSRVHGSGSVMVWACVGFGVRWMFVRQTLDAVEYFESVSRVHLVPYGTDLGGPNWIFQQDHASIHDCAARLPEFRRLSPRLLAWPSSSPDLNPVENVWGIIASKVYEGGANSITWKT